MTVSLRSFALALVTVAGLAACTTPPPGPTGAAPAGTPSAPPAAPTPAPAPSPAPAPAPAPAPVPGAAFVRPAAGAVIARFDGRRIKGIEYAGEAGDPIVASADGRVILVNSQLRGYGNMVVVQHNDGYLTAYAHARTILVKEKDVVRQGQTIAEMGKSGTDRVKLRFELRKKGVAVDPQPYLDGKLR